MTDHSRTARSALLQGIDDSLKYWSLLESRFYQAWNDGGLPISALQRYASEYGTFISLISDGWSTIGEPAIALEEQEHTELWRAFASALDVEILPPTHPGMREIIGTARKFFRDPTQALGALYAFEAQQPGTARTKLRGLKDHYATVPQTAYAYFEVHENDTAEPEMLRRAFEDLRDENIEVAARACSEMCEALRRGLDDLYDSYCPTKGSLMQEPAYS